MSDAQTKTAALIATFWLRIRPLVEERLAVLEDASSAAAAGTLTDEARVHAAGCAHKLAGSLGLYGFNKGTDLARELDALMNGAAPDPARLAWLVAELRTVVFPAA
jgi:hypothetical protein